MFREGKQGDQGFNINPVSVVEKVNELPATIIAITVECFPPALDRVFKYRTTGQATAILTETGTGLLRPAMALWSQDRLSQSIFKGSSLRLPAGAN